MQRTLLFLAFATLAVPSAAWLSCMTYSCAALGANTCASVGTGNGVNLAQSPCSTGYSCRFQDIATWYTSNATTRANTLQCTSLATATIGNTWTCPNRAAGKNLATGNYPKFCLSDTDCLLVDGSSNTCVCTPQTNSTSGYCKPDVSSNYFQLYWNMCTANGNQILGQYEGYYWYLKTQFSVYYDVPDLPACSQSLWEFSELTNAIAMNNTAVAIALVGVGLLLT